MDNPLPPPLLVDCTLKKRFFVLFAASLYKIRKMSKISALADNTRTDCPRFTKKSESSDFSVFRNEELQTEEEGGWKRSIIKTDARFVRDIYYSKLGSVS